MTTLLVYRERLKKIYTVHSLLIDRVLRGLVCLVVFLLINANCGYMQRLNFVGVPVFMAIVGAFLPYGLLTVVSAFYILLHLSAVSLEVLLIVAAIMVIIFCLYFVFQPGDGFLIVIMTAAFALNIPLVAVVAIGLVGSVYSVIPVCIGALLHFVLLFVKDNVVTLSSTGTLGSGGRLLQMLTGLAGYRMMWAMIVIMGVTMILVYVLRRQSINHSWRVAIAAGILGNIIFILIARFGMDMNISALWIIANGLLAGLVGLGLEFFLFHQDYSRTEYVQFEDDDYYYYVKAVPKFVVTQPEVTVQTISEQNKEYGAGGEELFPNRADLGATSEIFTAGRDLEATQNLFDQIIEEKMEEIAEDEAMDAEVTEAPEEEENMDQQ